MSDTTEHTRACVKCTGLQVRQVIREDATIIQYRCLNCGRIDEPGLVPNARVFTWGMGQYTAAAQKARRDRKAEERGDAWDL